MKKLIFLLLAVLAPTVFGAGTVTVTRASIYAYDQIVRQPTGYTVTVTWTADASAATVPDTEIPLKGWFVKAVVNPGATAPTANYDVTLTDPADTSFDTLGGVLNNLSDTATQQAYPTFSGSTLPIYLNGTYILKWANNAVNSAVGVMTFYFLH